MKNSENFGHVNLNNFRVYVDKLPAFRKFLELGVDSILGVKPIQTSISQFCVENSYKNKPIPKSWVPDENGGYLERRPVHYWLDISNEALEVCNLGNGCEIDVELVENGRETFAEQKDLVDRTMELLEQKNFENDVLPFIPFDTFRGNDINEQLLKSIINSPGASFDLREFGDGIVNVSGEDLRGFEKMGYTITQRYNNEDILEIGLCKAYYPK